ALRAAVAGLCPPPPGVAVPGVRAYEDCRRRLRAIPDDGEIAAQRRKCGLDSFWIDALRDVTTAPEFADALGFGASRLTTEHRETVARALVAQLLVLRQQEFVERQRRELRAAGKDESLVEDDGLIDANGDDRDQLVELLLVALGGRTRSWLG